MSNLKMLKKEGNEPSENKLRPVIRQLCWVARNIFWNHLFPPMTTVTSTVVGSMIKARVPIVSSPSIVGRLYGTKSVDGALIAGLLPNAWAKYALPKGLPGENEKFLAIENEPHFVDDFDGAIGKGYGEGVKRLLLSDLVIVKVNGKTSVQKINYHVHKTTRSGGREHYDIVVTGIKPGTKQWELNVPRGQYKGRYAFVSTNGASIVVRMKDQGIVIPKPDYTLRKEEVLSAIDPKKVIVERKIDGSLGNASIQGQRVAFRSHRNGGETYYDRLPSVEFLRNESSFAVSRYLYPDPGLTGTVFQGELAHQDGAARVSGILNSLPTNARAIQFRRGAVHFYIWDVLKYKGRDVSGLSYEERRALCERLIKDIRFFNKYWDIAEKSGEGETPSAFYKRVIKAPLPWGEGIVVKPRDLAPQKWDKIKMTGFGYFKLVGILPGDQGKYAQSAGRLVVENLETGARGEVGSLAVPDEFRNWMWNHRSDLVGEIVKVRSQEVTARGVPRAGVFYGFHDSEVDLLMQAEAATGSTDPSVVKPMVYRIKSAAGWKRKG